MHLHGIKASGQCCTGVEQCWSFTGSQLQSNALKLRELTDKGSIYALICQGCVKKFY